MKQELIYKKPECLVIEIEMQQVIAASNYESTFTVGGYNSGYGSAEEEW